MKQKNECSKLSDAQPTESIRDGAHSARGMDKFLPSPPHEKGEDPPGGDNDQKLCKSHTKNRLEWVKITALKTPTKHHTVNLWPRNGSNSSALVFFWGGGAV